MSRVAPTLSQAAEVINPLRLVITVQHLFWGLFGDSHKTAASIREPA